MQRRRFLGASAAILTALLCVADAAAEQPTKMPVIGFLGSSSLDTYAPYLPAFHRGLNDTDYVEGQNVAIDLRWAYGHYERLPELVADLIARKADVMVTAGGPAASAAKNATSTIPIVFLSADDPVRNGLVASLARPGRNVTGVSIIIVELGPKRLELLSDLVPQANVVALLVNPNNPNADLVISDLQAAARAKGLQLHIFKTGTKDEIDDALASLAQLHANALLISADPFFNTQSDQIVALAARHGVPAIYARRGFLTAGGLISYGPNQAATWRQVGTYAGKILNGAKRADLPVQQPTTFELVINLKTAKALGLNVPPAILARADEVIE